MQSVLCQLLWLALYGYYVERAGSLQKGAGRRAVLWALCLGCVGLSGWIPSWLAWVLIAGLVLLFALFFDEEPFACQWWRMLLPGLLFSAAAALPAPAFFWSNGLLCAGLFLLLARKRGYLGPQNALAVCVGYGMLSLSARLFCSTDRIAMGPALRNGILWGHILLELLLLTALEGSLAFWKHSYEYQAEQFQKEVLQQQYAEIRSIYLDMRGWRHDYHNHLQVLKAQLAMGHQEDMRRYLDELEQDLDRVDTYVKTGNLTVDAILNSKLSLAKDRQIPFTCKAQLGDKLTVEDVDLCVILGNLLDNAMEACMQIEPQKRFLRIYLAVRGRQFYLSIQNGAKEELNFCEKNYISTKRGSHGFGMKRVKAMVEKHEGFLRLANEPGIFAAEVTMPL